MRYRIKITTFANGRKEYIPQKKVRFSWLNIGFEGEIVGMEYGRDTRGAALHMIDLNYNGNTKVQTIEFEYITKNN